MILSYILGLYKLQIKNNPLVDIPEEAFLGLERSLWELDLSYNQFVSVPSKSFRHLQNTFKQDKCIYVVKMFFKQLYF